MTLQEFFVSLGLDTDAQSFAKGQLAVHALEKGLGLLAQTTMAAFKALPHLVGETAHHADQVDELAQSTGISTTALQELAYAGQFSSLGLEEMGQSMVHLIRHMNEAKTGGGDAAAAFAKVGGVLGADGKLKSADDVLLNIAEKFQAMPGGAEKTALAMQLFGKSGAKMIPFLNAGRDGIAELRKEAHDLGLVLDEEAIKMGAEYSDNIDKLKSGWMGLKHAAGEALLPAFKALTDVAFEWVKANSAAIRSGIHKFMVVLTTAVKALYHVLKLAWDIGKRFVEFLIAGSEAAKFMTGVFIGLTGVILLYARASAFAALKTAAAWALAALPFVAIAALLAFIVLVAQDLWVGLNGGESFIFKAFDALGNKLKELSDENFFVGMLKEAMLWLTNFDDQWKFFIAGLKELWKQLGADIISGPLVSVVRELISALKFLQNISVSGSVEKYADKLKANAAENDALINRFRTAGSSASVPITPITLNVGSIIAQVPPNGTPEQINSGILDALDQWTKTKMREAIAAVR